MDSKQPMAFPQMFNTAQREGMGGMTLRDYFAAHAVIGEGESSELTISMARRLMGRDHPTEADANAAYWFKAEARLRYAKADAMLKARESS